MDKVLSTRLDEKVLQELDFATTRLGMTKKQFLEEAIRMRAKAANTEETLRVLRATFGGWRREDESIDDTIASIRQSRRDEERRKAEYFDSLGPPSDQ